jgi:hypothetical protein
VWLIMLATSACWREPVPADPVTPAAAPVVASHRGGGPLSPARVDRASVHGKYSSLVTTIHVPDDQAEYGDFRDWGYWGGGTYKGNPDAPAGYWVYLAPYWYIWANVAGAGE